MEIHLQTTDHVVAVEKVAEQHIGTKLCSCNTFEDISHLLIHSYKSYNYIREKCYYSKVGQSSPNLFPLSIGYSCTTLWVKNSLEIALSLTVCEIFVIFHIFTKSSNKVAITHLYIEQQL